jgi:hypothetical protein
MRARASERGMRMKKGETAAVVIINAGGFCCFLICLTSDMTVEIVNSATKTIGGDARQ